MLGLTVPLTLQASADEAIDSPIGRRATCFWNNQAIEEAHFFLLAARTRKKLSGTSLLERR
jgi:hypothetical protein